MVLAQVAVVVALVAGCTGSPAPGAATSTSGARPTAENAPDPRLLRDEAVSALLAARADALKSRDRAAFEATLDRPSSGFGLRQLAQFDAIAQLPLATFGYGTPEPAPELSAERASQVGPEAFVTRVQGRYSLAGYDRAQREFESYFTFVHRAGRWLLADDSDGGTQPQLWDIPRFTVLRSPKTLVVGSGPASRLRPFLALGDTAVTRVKAVWTPKWSASLVLVVPASAEQMAEQVGQEPAQVSQVAAVTDGPFDAQGRAGADRVVVNPGAFATLQPRGRQVVVTHEATHVAIRATTTRPVPLWLSEGMADYVGYRDIGVGPGVVASALLDRVRAGKVPSSLPAAADFDPTRTTIAPSYNAAWLAVRRIEDRFGRDALVKFYLAAATAPDPNGPAGDPEVRTRDAFGSVLGTSEAAFTRDWVRYLRALAAG
jgi:hypothetical protein